MIDPRNGRFAVRTEELSSPTLMLVELGAASGVVGHTGHPDQLPLGSLWMRAPGWLARLLTHPVRGLDRYAELFETLGSARGAIKVYCEVAG